MAPMEYLHFLQRKEVKAKVDQHIVWNVMEVGRVCFTWQTRGEEMPNTSQKDDRQMSNTRKEKWLTYFKQM